MLETSPSFRCYGSWGQSGSVVNTGGIGCEGSRDCPAPAAHRSRCRRRNHPLRLNTILINDGEHRIHVRVLKNEFIYVALDFNGPVEIEPRGMRMMCVGSRDESDKKRDE